MKSRQQLLDEAEKEHLQLVKEYKAVEALIEILLHKPVDKDNLDLAYKLKRNLETQLHRIGGHLMNLALGD